MRQSLGVSVSAAPSQWRPVQHQPLLDIQGRPRKPSMRFPFGAVPFLRLLNYPKKFCRGVKSRRHPLQTFQADTTGSWIFMATRNISRKTGRAWRSSLLVQGNKSDSWPDLNLFFFFGGSSGPKCPGYCFHFSLFPLEKEAKIDDAGGLMDLERHSKSERE